ncbi:type II toxin-antitoxin system HipA family toxin [Isoptericola halotolerans]|uniref:type II toxin-antitoxin system HipA family toxin n=1 Tax=Isoptericola halotolerans TaxID=300560 RepID=UPI00388EBAB7
MTARQLVVSLYGAVIGRIDQRAPSAEPEFTYTPDYLAQGSTPIGIRMPLADTTYRGRPVRAFLDGLLPEAQGTRDQWARRLSVPAGDTVGVLAQMGWDCPGAVQFCRPEELDEMRARSHETTPVGVADIAERLRDLRTGSQPSWTLPGERWSLAGQQAKFALRRDGDGWSEARGSAATTHIVKPGIGILSHQALVEHATMRAARTLGLDVARSEYQQFDGESAIVVTRYDRARRQDGTVLRLHQEDFCSAFGRSPRRKYESNGGPGLADMARLVRQNVGDRRTGLRALGDFAAFNYVAGAPDGHAKNISLLLLPGTTRVAPLYDLATALPYQATNRALQEIAVSIGGRRAFGQVLGKHWDRAATLLNMSSDEMRSRARAMAEDFPDAFADALHGIGTSEAEEIRVRSLDVVLGHTRRVLERLDDPVELPADRRRPSTA